MGRVFWLFGEKSDLVAQAGLDQFDCLLQHFSFISTFALNFDLGAALDAGSHQLHDAFGVNLLLTVNDGDVALKGSHFLDEHTGGTGVQTLLIDDGYFSGYHMKLLLLYSSFRRYAVFSEIL